MMTEEEAQERLDRANHTEMALAVYCQQLQVTDPNITDGVLIVSMARIIKKLMDLYPPQDMAQLRTHFMREFGGQNGNPS